MTLYDFIALNHRSLADPDLATLRDQVIDRAMAEMPEGDLYVIREMVALEHEKRWPPLGDIVRKADPRMSPVVRAELFARLPPPAGAKR